MFEWSAVTHVLCKIYLPCRVKTLFATLVFLEITIVWVLIDYGHAKHGGKTWNARLGRTSYLVLLVFIRGSCRWGAAIM